MLIHINGPTMKLNYCWRSRRKYKTKQIAKSIDWESCVDKYGEILETYSAHYPSPEDAAAIGKDFPHKKNELMYGLNSSASFRNDVLDILKFSLHSSSIVVSLIKLSHHALVLPGRVQNRLRRWFALFLTLWCPLFIDNNLKTSCRSLMYWLCKFIKASFIWTHDIKLEIRATNKEATTLLYAMFVYNARREDWIQENDESVFENFRLRPSTRIRIRIG